MQTRSKTRLKEDNFTPEKTLVNKIPPRRALNYEALALPVPNRREHVPPDVN